MIDCVRPGHFRKNHALIRRSAKPEKPTQPRRNTVFQFACIQPLHQTSPSHFYAPFVAYRRQFVPGENVKPSFESICGSPSATACLVISLCAGPRSSREPAVHPDSQEKLSIFTSRMKMSAFLSAAETVHLRMGKNCIMKLARILLAALFSIAPTQRPALPCRLSRMADSGLTRERILRRNEASSLAHQRKQRSKRFA